jgi:hypothetical protein
MTTVMWVHLRANCQVVPALVPVALVKARFRMKKRQRKLEPFILLCTQVLRCGGGIEFFHVKNERGALLQSLLLLQ